MEKNKSVKAYEIMKVAFYQNLAVYTCPNCQWEFVILVISKDPHDKIGYPITDPTDQLLHEFYCPHCGKNIKEE